MPKGGCASAGFWAAGDWDFAADVAEATWLVFDSAGGIFCWLTGPDAMKFPPEWAAVWFGILFVMNIQIYFLSPPFGPACFWLKSVAPKDVTLQEIFLSVLPFICLQIIGLALVMAFPQIALWLPGL